MNKKKFKYPCLFSVLGENDLSRVDLLAVWWDFRAFDGKSLLITAPIHDDIDFMTREDDDCDSCFDFFSSKFSNWAVFSFVVTEEITFVVSTVADVSGSTSLLDGVLDFLAVPEDFFLCDEPLEVLLSSLKSSLNSSERRKTKINTMC